MFKQILLFICVVKMSYAVVIHTSENQKEDLVKAKPQGWQMVKIYHQPQSFVYKYEPYAYPKYEFEYSVSDTKTGDHKHHSESRDGDRVRGEYSLVESDGSLRKVQYHADDHNGFNAIVSKTVNKHGDHAISVTDHTRFFYPIGHNVKINHYFPGKDYQYQDMVIPDDKMNKPVHEEATINVKNMNKIELGNNLMKIEPVQAQELMIAPKSEEPMMKVEQPETMPVQLVPTDVSLIPNSTEENKFNAESISSVPIQQNIDISLAKEIPLDNESQKLEKEDNNDSEVASSFYTSKYYYIIQ